MLTLPGVTGENYYAVLGNGRPVPEIPCTVPSCDLLMTGHGWYKRYLDGVKVRFRRVICKPCGVTHSILPEDVCAYRDLRLSDLEAALRAEGGPTAKAKASEQEGEDAVRRVRRWVRRWGEGWLEPLQWLLPGSEGSGWERIKAVYGDAPGALIRLRRWLWSRCRYFFSGLTGLYRHGRPRFVVLGFATEVGSSPSG